MPKGFVGNQLKPEVPISPPDKPQLGNPLDVVPGQPDVTDQPQPPIGPYPPGKNVFDPRTASEELTPPETSPDTNSPQPEPSPQPKQSFQSQTEPQPSPAPSPATVITPYVNTDSEQFPLEQGSAFGTNIRRIHETRKKTYLQ